MHEWPLDNLTSNTIFRHKRVKKNKNTSAFGLATVLKKFTRKHLKKCMELIKHMNAELTWYTWQWSTRSLNYGMPKVICSSRSVLTFSFMWVIDVELLWERTHCTSRCDKMLLCSQWFLCHAPSQRKAKWPVSGI